MVAPSLRVDGTQTSKVVLFRCASFGEGWCSEASLSWRQFSIELWGEQLHRPTVRCPSSQGEGAEGVGERGNFKKIPTHTQDPSR